MELIIVKYWKLKKNNNLYCILKYLGKLVYVIFNIYILNSFDIYVM